MRSILPLVEILTLSALAGVSAFLSLVAWAEALPLPV